MTIVIAGVAQGLAMVVVNMSMSVVVNLGTGEA
jgi:hypothetical protein